ncbi:hypothetical protein DIPPA_08824 [Diplonema papillatum]|nr:hypothetical protein DIPPA_08824 [Diplonema papillatum]
MAPLRKAPPRTPAGGGQLPAGFAPAGGGHGADWAAAANDVWGTMRSSQVILRRNEDRLQQWRQGSGGVCHACGGPTACLPEQTGGQSQSESQKLPAPDELSLSSACKLIEDEMNSLLAHVTGPRASGVVDAVRTSYDPPRVSTPSAHDGGSEAPASSEFARSRHVSGRFPVNTDLTPNNQPSKPERRATDTDAYVPSPQWTPLPAFTSTPRSTRSSAPQAARPVKCMSPSPPVAVGQSDKRSDPLAGAFVAHRTGSEDSVAPYGSVRSPPQPTCTRLSPLVVPKQAGAGVACAQDAAGRSRGGGAFQTTDNAESPSSARVLRSPTRRPKVAVQPSQTIQPRAAVDSPRSSLRRLHVNPAEIPIRAGESPRNRRHEDESFGGSGHDCTIYVDEDGQSPAPAAAAPAPHGTPSGGRTGAKKTVSFSEAPCAPSAGPRLAPPATPPQAARKWNGPGAGDEVSADELVIVDELRRQ